MPRSTSIALHRPGRHQTGCRTPLAVRGLGPRSLLVFSFGSGIIIDRSFRKFWYYVHKVIRIFAFRWWFPTSSFRSSDKKKTIFAFLKKNFWTIFKLKQILNLNNFKFQQFSNLNNFKFKLFSNLNIFLIWTIFYFEQFSMWTNFKFEQILHLNIF
jgi:hypothetical protein